MRRVLVPLDGSWFAETILPDALRLAGQDGELILIRDASWTHVDTRAEEYSQWHAVEETERYLDDVARRMEDEGVRATAYRLTASDVSAAIDDTASFLHVDMVACATHGRGPLGRLLFGGIVWKALAESQLPVLLRHTEDDPPEESATPAIRPITRALQDMQRRIMIPLDGSSFAEAAIPTAENLAAEWKAPIYLARIVPAPSTAGSLFRGSDDVQAEIDDARAYLVKIGAQLAAEVHADVFSGSPIARLVAGVADWGITDVVVTSHGHTGLKRALFGSVTDELIRHVHCPTVVLPRLAVESIGQDRDLAQQRGRVSLT